MKKSQEFSHSFILAWNDSYYEKNIHLYNQKCLLNIVLSILGDTKEVILS